MFNNVCSIFVKCSCNYIEILIHRFAAEDQNRFQATRNLQQDVVVLPLHQTDYTLKANLKDSVKNIGARY